MTHDLRKHQKDAIAYALRRKRIALFMEMRLGKSVVAIRWAKHHQLRRVLLVGPLTTLRGSTQWQGELTRESIAPVFALPSIKKSKWSATMRRTKMVQRGRQWWISKEWTPGWFLINYEALRPDILDQPWDGIIIDESTRIRNPKANITKLLLNHTDHVKHKAMLTGLPNPEASWDYFCQFQFLHGHFMGMDNYWAWRHRYFHQGVPSWNWQPNRGTREAIREYVHENAFVLQRKTAGVGSEKRRHTIVVPMNKAQKIAMRTIRREMAIAGVETKWATVAHLWMQRLAGGWHPTLDNPPYLLSERKMKALRKLLKKVKVAVVWFRFNHEIESTYRYLRKSMPHLRLRYVHGAMAKSKELRVKYQEQFQAGKLDVLLLQVKLGRFGWNLSRSDVAIYYSNSYEYEDRSQSEDRLIHLTKTRDCHYYDLVTEHSTDEDLVESLRSKKITARLFGRRIKESLKRLIGRAA